MPADTVLVANSSDRIRRYFENTPWAAGWLSTLARAPGAAPVPRPFKFGGVTSRALAIPAAVLLGEDDEPSSATEYGVG